MGISVKLTEAQFQRAVDVLNANSGIESQDNGKTILTLSSGLLEKMGLQENKAASNIFIRGQLLQILHKSLSGRANEQLVKTFLENAEKTLYGPLIDNKQYSTETASQGLTVATVKTLLSDLNELKLKLRGSTPKFTFENLLKFSTDSKRSSNVGEVRLDKKGKLKLINTGNVRKVVTTPVQNEIVRRQVCECISKHVKSIFEKPEEHLKCMDGVEQLLISKEVINLPLTKPELKSILAYLKDLGTDGIKVGQVNTHLSRLRAFNDWRFGQNEGEVTKRIENNLKIMYNDAAVLKCKDKYGEQFNILRTKMLEQYRNALEPLISIGNKKVSDSQLKDAIKAAIRNIINLRAGGWNDIRTTLDKNWLFVHDCGYSFAA